MFIIMLLIIVIIIEYINLVIPKKIDPTIIINVFIVKFEIDSFILKYFLSIRFSTVIPPDEKFILYIIPPVIPHVIPASSDDINIFLVIISMLGIGEVIFTNNGYRNVDIMALVVVSFFKNIKLIIREIMFIKNIIVDALSFKRCFIIIAKPCVPPVTRFRGFKNRLKLRAANNSDVISRRYFFMFHLIYYYDLL